MVSWKFLHQCKRYSPELFSLSIYLYVILKNILSKMLNAAASAGEFGYHHSCQAINLTHLSFADDILVFIDGHPHSLKGVLDVMDMFTIISGLYINTAKSSIYADDSGF